MNNTQQDITDITKEYYDSKNADEFYYTVWGGEDIHIGIYKNDDEPILDASNRTVSKMASMIGKITANTEVLDIGSGYGGAARYLASMFGCKISCFNLSKVENERNKQKNFASGLNNLISVFTGSFEDIPFKDELFDVVWSEDAILHSGNKSKVFEEAYRLLKPGGTFIFTDPMQSDNCPEGVLQPILDRIHLEQMGSVKLYKELANTVGFVEPEIIEMPDELPNHYARVLNKLEENENSLLSNGCDVEFIDRMKTGLSHWVDGGNKGYLNWGILKFEKPN